MPVDREGSRIELRGKLVVFRRLLLTVSTVLWLWGAYALYSAAVSPHLQPSTASLRPGPALESPELAERTNLDSDALAQKYLRDAPWINASANGHGEDQLYQLQVGKNLKIFTCEIPDQRSSREVHFKPLAMMITTEEALRGESEPITIVAESAVIKFLNEFDIHKSPGRIVGGQFNGRVILRGPDNLSLIGDKFFFDEQIQSPSSILYSDSLVKFTYGPHRGQGVQFNVEFSRLQGKIPDDLPAIGGIEKLWINRDVHLELVDTKRGAKQPPQGHARQRRGEMLFVDAQGRMTFDMRQNRLTLEDHVRLVHPDAHGKQDTIDCELLVMELINPDAASGVQVTQETSDSKFRNWFPKRLELGSITATGNPEKLVRISSPQHDMWGDMRSVQYDLRQRKLILLEEKREGVHIVQGGYDIRCPEIRVEHGPEYELLQIECPRPGKLVSRGGRQSPFQAEWQERMAKHPSADVPGQDVVELHGQAQLIRPLEKMSLTAEHLLAGFTGPNEKLSPNGTGGRRATTSPESEFKNVKLHWVTAHEKVNLVHPRVIGDTERLAINFEDFAGPLPVSEFGSKASPAPESKPKNPDRDSPPNNAGPVQQASAEQSKDVVADTTPAFGMPEGPPPRINAGELQVKILQHGKQQHVAEVKGLNRFEMQQEHSDGSQPLQVRGEWVELLNHPGRDQELILHGQPATIEDQGNKLTGPLIKVLRQKNHAEVIGPGHFTGPVKTPSQGKSPEKFQDLSVKWREKVTFDGQSIVFYDRVVCELEESSMSCPEMVVELSEPISFIDPQVRSARKKSPEIRRLECKHQVVFEQNSHELGKHTMRAVGDVTNFTTDRVTGKTLASGPGTLRVWRHKQPGSKSNAQPSLVQTTLLKDSGTDPREWEFQEVRFRKQMQGNFNQKFTVFEGPVQVIYGPVSLPTELIPLENLPTDGGTMDCSELQLTQESTGGKTNFNLLGKGNVRIEGFGFHALADEINHDQSKSQYKLRAHGRGLVNLWYRDLDSGQDKRAAGESFDFRVVDGAVKELKGHRTSIIDGTD